MSRFLILFAKVLGIPSTFAKKNTSKEVLGGVSWIRTSDTRIFSPMLYQLSYNTY